MNRWNEVDEKLVRRLGNVMVHSMSVGDVVMNKDKAYVVAPVGFNPLELQGVA